MKMQCPFCGHTERIDSSMYKDLRKYACVSTYICAKCHKVWQSFRNLTTREAQVIQKSILDKHDGRAAN